MGTLRHSVWVKARAEDVWRTYVDPYRIPEWQTGSPLITDVQGAAGAPHSTYTSKRGPGTALTSVLSADPPRRIETTTRAYFGLEFDVVSQFEPDANGTRLNLLVKARWPRGLGLIGKLVEFVILGRHEARKELENLKALVEREAEGDGDIGR